uniref:hypothetical protein n=1 Tax=uncultured Eubacterium sp. TaxID=165185 RepID=UPI0025DC13B1
PRALLESKCKQNYNQQGVYFFFAYIRFNDDKSVVTNFSYEDIISATLDLIMYSNNHKKFC